MTSLLFGLAILSVAMISLEKRWSGVVADGGGFIVNDVVNKAAQATIVVALGDSPMLLGGALPFLRLIRLSVC
jgi:hypothetical protein